MEKAELINFTMFQDWLLWIGKGDKAYVIANNMRLLEEYLIYLVGRKDYLYTSADKERKAAPIRSIYDKLLNSRHALNTKSRRLGIENNVVDMFRKIFDVLKDTEKFLPDFLDSSDSPKKSKSTRPLSTEEKKKRSSKICSEWKTDLRYYLKFLEYMFGLTGLEAGCADKFKKTGRKMSVIPSDVPVESSLFKKGIVHILRQAHVALTSGPNKIELTMDTLVNLLDTYTQLHKQSQSAGDLNLFKGISFMTSLGAVPAPSLSPGIKIRSWEAAFLKNAKIKVDGEEICINDNDNVLFNSEELALTIYNDEVIRNVDIPPLCSENTKEYALHIRPTRNLSIRQENVFLSKLYDVCRQALDDMCMHIPLARYKSEAYKYIERINANFNKLQSIYDFEQAEADVYGSDKKCSRYNLMDLSRCFGSLMHNIEPSSLIGCYGRVCEILEEYGSHYEIELVAE